MSNLAKPLMLIVLALAAATGAAFYLTRENSQPPEDSSVRDLTSDSANPSTARGPSDAPLTLVEFGDYECPSCAYYHPIVNEVLRRYPDEVRLEFRHYPLISIHPNAMLAAMAAEAAGEQGRYWEMHDLLFETQPRWSQSGNAEAEFVSLAGRLGLDMNQFMQALRSPNVEQRVLEDVVAAREANVEAVPTFFLNGRRISSGRGVEDFVQVLDAELAALQQ